MRLKETPAQWKHVKKRKRKEKVKVHSSPVLSTYSRINMDFIYTVIYNIAHVTYCKVIRIMTGFNFIVITQL